jgi:hypothetical protein
MDRLLRLHSFASVVTICVFLNPLLVPQHRSLAVSLFFLSLGGFSTGARSLTFLFSLSLGRSFLNVYLVNLSLGCLFPNIVSLLSVSFQPIIRWFLNQRSFLNFLFNLSLGWSFSQLHSFQPVMELFVSQCFFRFSAVCPSGFRCLTIIQPISGVFRFLRMFVSASQLFV